jgi:hypothetical protein
MTEENVISISLLRNTSHRNVISFRKQNRIFLKFKIKNVVLIINIYIKIIKYEIKYET